MKNTIQHSLSFLFVVLIFAISTASAQKLATNLKTGAERADELYHRFDYPEALKEYRYQYDKVKRKDDKIKETGKYALMVANCYRKMNLPEETLNWYEIANGAGVLGTFDLYNYAEMLSQAKKYPKAKQYYAKFYEKAPNDTRAARKLKAVSNIGQFYGDSSRFIIVNAPFNTKVSDFGPAFYDEGLVYVSEFDKKFFVKNEHNWHGKDFLTFYYTETIDSTNTEGLQAMRFKNPRPFNASLNSKFHEGPSVFYNSEKDFIFTRNNYHNGKVRQSQDNTIKLKLFHAQAKGNDWTDVEPLPFNSDEYSVGHPAISSDGLTLYFSSDMPGGVGNVDLYKVTRASLDDEWGTPVNVGKPINTEGDEMFPFFFKDSVLFFASNGHGGLGGLDIMQSELRMGMFQEPENMGYPLNSSKDDFGLILRENYTGFFASNRSGGKGDDDIFVILVKAKLMVPIEGVLAKFNYTSNDSARVPGGVITIVNKNDSTDRIVVETDAEGHFYFKSEPGKEYVVLGQKDSLKADAQTILVPNEDYLAQNPGPVKVKLLVVEGSSSKIPIRGIFRHIVGEDTTLVANAAISVVNQDDPNDKFSLSTNSEGVFNFVGSSDAAYSIHGSHPNGQHNDKKFVMVPKKVKPSELPLMVILETGETAAKPIVLNIEVFTQNDQMKNKGRSVTLHYLAKDQASPRSSTLSRGETKMELTPGYTYYFSAHKMGYTDNCLVVEVDKNASGQTIDEMLVLEQFLTGGKANFVIDNLYYDFDKSYIRPDAAKELNKLIELMEKFPGTKVELSSHTDCRGSDKYNEALAQRRADAAVAYLVKKGIDRDRLTAKGYGEYRLVNKCDDGVPCSRDQHQANRRTEVTIANAPKLQGADNKAKPTPTANEVFSDLNKFDDCKTVKVK